LLQTPDDENHKIAKQLSKQGIIKEERILTTRTVYSFLFKNSMKVCHKIMASRRTKNENHQVTT
jgi:hypothetical protein